VTYTPPWNPPSISGLAPASGKPGETFTVTGADLHDGLTVKVGSAAAAATFDEAGDPVHIAVTVPVMGAGTYTVTVVNLDGKTSNGIAFQVLAVPWNAPSISTLAPASGKPGDGFTITGADFHAGLNVAVGSAAAAVAFDEVGDPTHIRVTVPEL